MNGIDLLQLVGLIACVIVAITLSLHWLTAFRVFPEIGRPAIIGQHVIVRFVYPECGILISVSQ